MQATSTLDKTEQQVYELQIGKRTHAGFWMRPSKTLVCSQQAEIYQRVVQCSKQEDKMTTSWDKVKPVGNVAGQLGPRGRSGQLDFW
jgi:hypothetical protein